MPLNRCTKDGKSGWRWGSQKCYTGPDAKEKAAKQGYVIKKHWTESKYIQAVLEFLRGKNGTS